MISKVIKFLSSVKFAIVMISLIVLLSLPATFISQNQSDLFYQQTYEGELGHLIVGLGYDHFFQSPLFLILVGLFWLNLLFCSIKRFRLQIQKRTQKKFGPDIIHLGLLLLVVFAIWSGFTRREGVIYLSRSDSLQLPSGRYLLLKDFKLETYEDGRPRLYSSQVSIVGPGGENLSETHYIEVNSPLRIDGLTIYQYSYKPDVKPMEYKPGLMIVQDSVKPLIFISLIITSAGFLLTFIQKEKT